MNPSALEFLALKIADSLYEDVRMIGRNCLDLMSTNCIKLDKTGQISGEWKLLLSSIKEKLFDDLQFYLRYA